ncbi:hypothetical protein EON65_57770 [archaeon]|nr:MAG: hypothetical protein EON65_57770 [archaeon]
METELLNALLQHRGFNRDIFDREPRDLDNNQKNQRKLIREQVRYYFDRLCTLLYYGDEHGKTTACVVVIKGKVTVTHKQQGASNGTMEITPVTLPVTSVPTTPITTPSVPAVTPSVPSTPIATPSVPAVTPSVPSTPIAAPSSPADECDASNVIEDQDDPDEESENTETDEGSEPASRFLRSRTRRTDISGETNKRSCSVATASICEETPNVDSD